MGTELGSTTPDGEDCTNNSYPVESFKGHMLLRAINGRYLKNFHPRSVWKSSLVARMGGQINLGPRPRKKIARQKPK